MQFLLKAVSLFDAKRVCEFAAGMKVTIDLPEDLVRDLERSAILQHRSFEEIVSERLSTSHTVALPHPQQGVAEGFTNFPVLEASCCGTSEVAGLSPQEMSEWVKHQAAHPKSWLRGDHHDEIVTTPGRFVGSFNRHESGAE